MISSHLKWKWTMWILKRKKSRTFIIFQLFVVRRSAVTCFKYKLPTFFSVVFFFLTSLKTASDPFRGFWRSPYWMNTVFPWEDPAVHSNVSGWLSLNWSNVDLWLDYFINGFKYEPLQSSRSSLRQHIPLILFYSFAL